MLNYLGFYSEIKEGNMNIKTIKNNFWKIEKRSAQQYNDFNEYIIKDKIGNIISKIPYDRSIADRIVDCHNQILLDLLCEEQ